MKKNTHTPGPWFFHRDELLHERHPHGSYTLIADVDQDENGLDWETNEANARLIAAAPELLEALEGLLCLWQKVDRATTPEEIAAEYAIAKARGQL